MKKFVSLVVKYGLGTIGFLLVFTQVNPKDILGGLLFAFGDFLLVVGLVYILDKMDIGKSISLEEFVTSILFIIVGILILSYLRFSMLKPITLVILGLIMQVTALTMSTGGK